MIIAGITLLFTGLLVRVLSAVSLKSNMSWRIVMPQRIVKTGLYKYVRHPLYLGAILIYGGLCLILTRSTGIMVVMEFFAVQWLLDRIDREEQMLVATYGEEYLEYMHKTKMLIPFII
jgi:protein-S-isoprenylcysteine O-methyltransferase Ste14